MKAVTYSRFGPAAEVLKICEVDSPDVGPLEVKVRIMAIGVNPSDVKARGGLRAKQMQFQTIIPHQDGSGIIIEVGQCVSADRIGERVWIYEAQRGRAFGTAGEYVVVPSDNAVTLPAEASFDCGASLGVPAMTAHRCLFADGDIRGRTVLIHGGAGGVGTAAILLAKWAGAIVITTVSRPEQEAVAVAAGADRMIFRNSDSVAEQTIEFNRSKKVDRIVDVALIENFATNLACLKDGGTISAYGVNPLDATLNVPFLEIMTRNINVRWVFVYGMSARAHEDAKREINACISAGAYNPHIGQKFSFEEIIAAHQAQESGKVIGKILVSLG